MMSKNNGKRNIILVLVITGMIRGLFIGGSMCAVIWCRYTNWVANDTELIEKYVLNTFINIKLLFIWIV